MTGQTISHYKILSKLGEGGMGVVYKAEDERLKRIVALKFLPAQASGTDEDRARFLREAQAAAALDHPNICTVYEIDEAAGRVFLAMAFIEGQTLDQRIEAGPLPLKQALSVASQAAQGLQAAHKRSIVHRDIKASNLMIAGDNPAKPQVKLLDFGLAQLSGRSKLTQTDSLIGTISYMSPEQTQGDAVDQRSDIWSLGVVLYEMLAGELPFKGHYDQATMYSILNEDPQPLTAMRSGLPIEVDWIVEKCMAKSPDERYQSMEDLLVDLTTLEKKLDSERLSIHRTQLAKIDASNAPLTPPKAGTAGNPWRWAAIALGALAAALLITVVAVSLARETESSREAPAPVRRFEITLPQQASAGVPRLRSLAIAPDGSRLAFTLVGEEQRIWMRDLSQPAAYALDGTDGAREVFWSPDSASIGFLAGRSLLKIPASGGPAQTLAEVSQGVLGGGSWSPDGGSILYSSGPPYRLFEVPARGGEPKLLMESPGGRRGFPTEPQLLEYAGRRLLLYASRNPQGSQIAVREPASEEILVLAEGEQPFFAAAGDGHGYVLYRGGALSADIWALPFSMAEGQATGEPFPVASGGEMPSASGDGVLVYATDIHSGPLRLKWFNREGRVTAAIGRAHPQIRSPAVSPDGKSVAVISSEGGSSDVWIHDGESETARRLTATEESEVLVRWAPDGAAVTFTVVGDAGPSLYQVSATGGSAEELQAADGTILVDSSRDGSRVLVRQRGEGWGGYALLERNADGDYDLTPLGRAPGGSPAVGFNAGGGARLSPDGRFLAMETREGDQWQVIVRDLENSDRSWPVSAAGGGMPRWRGDGRELYFVRGAELFAVPVRPDAGSPLGEPELLFRRNSLEGGPRASGYDVSPDGNRFVLVELPDRPAPATISVMLNWLTPFQQPH